MPLRIWTRAAPRPSERWTPSNAMAGVTATEVSFMGYCARSRVPSASRSYGKPGRLVQRLAAALVIAVFAGGSVMAADNSVKILPVKIVALGDSLVAGYGLPANAAFPVQLEKALNAKGVSVEVANAGVSGDTSSGGLGRLDWSVPEGTEAVIVTLGANDMLRGLDPKVARDALTQ